MEEGSCSLSTSRPRGAELTLPLYHHSQFQLPSKFYTRYYRFDRHFPQVISKETLTRNYNDLQVLK